MIAILAPLALLQAVSGQDAPPAPSSAPPSPCASEEFQAFDFWVGEWDVYINGGERKVSESKIEKLYAGCGIRENWMPPGRPGGGSLSNLDPETGRWHQTWIGGGAGRVEFEGGSPAPGSMVLTGYWQNVNGPGQHALVRMTYTLQEDGSVRQHGEASSDHGLTWSDSFDFIYRRKPAD